MWRRRRGLHVHQSLILTAREEDDGYLAAINFDVERT
jgi:hypothetical protein